jgi:hypothetical protein
MTEDELKQKFRACARGVISDASIERLIAGVATLQSVANIRPLCDLMRGIG